MIFLLVNWGREDAPFTLEEKIFHNIALICLKLRFKKFDIGFGSAA